VPLSSIRLINTACRDADKFSLDITVDMSRISVQQDAEAGIFGLKAYGAQAARQRKAKASGPPTRAQSR
jgi:hypothetical protein